MAFLPAAVLGVLLDDWMEAKLFNSTVVAVALIVGGVVLIALERRHPSTTILTVYDLGFATAFFIGLFQCLAMVPGTSRSAATIIGAVLLGASRPAAAEFSFFLAIPTMLGATVFKLTKVGAHFTGYEWGLLAIGSLTAFLVAFSVVHMFMNYIQRRDFRPFGYYRIALGLNRAGPRPGGIGHGPGVDGMTTRRWMRFETGSNGRGRVRGLRIGQGRMATGLGASHPVDRLAPGGTFSLRPGHVPTRGATDCRGRSGGVLRVGAVACLRP